MNIRNIIKDKLLNIEQKENVRILHAVESGSRAWGFASPDSDYDVRFIYVRNIEYYLKLEKTRDVIEWQLDETLDINGWDLHKALRLLHSSNPTIFEWSNSPIIYKTTESWADVKFEINNYFNPKAGLYHYLNISNNNFRKHLEADTVKLKKYFYALRPILACKWILNNWCPPPMLFSDLVDSELELEMKPIIKDLLSVKMETPEIGEGERIDALNLYIDSNLISLKETIDGLPNEDKASWLRLNELFFEQVSKV